MKNKIASTVLIASCFCMSLPAGVFADADILINNGGSSGDLTFGGGAFQAEKSVKESSPKDKSLPIGKAPHESKDWLAENDGAISKPAQGI